MKLIVVHGDNREKIDKRIGIFINAAKNRSYRIERINPVKDQKLESVLTFEPLFKEKLFVVISNSTRLKKKDIHLITAKKDLDATLVLYNYKTLSKTFLKSLKNIDKDEHYEIPKLLFKFLESFYPGNYQNCIELLHELVKDEPVEMVFAMLARHLRDLYWVDVDPSTIPYPSWRVGKLENQAAKFEDGKLKNLIKKV